MKQKKNAKFDKRANKTRSAGDVKSNKVTPKFKGKDYNDFSWYDKNHQLVVDTANLPFNQQMSTIVDLNNSGGGKGLPMLMSLAHDWLIGAGDAVTTAGRMLWTDIRKHNSGATNYQSSDPIAIITAAADIFITIKWMSSFFGFSKYFNARNKTMPGMIFRSAGIDYDDFISNLADYRARFNKLLLQARVITIPKKYPWIDAAMALYGNMFKDEDTDTGREQLYVVNKALFYELVTEGQDGHYVVRPIKVKDVCNVEHLGLRQATGPMVVWTDIDEAYITGSSQAEFAFSGMAKFSTFLNVLERQITSIITDEDANIIQGDLIKAFGDGSAYTTGQMDETFEIKPMYSEEFGWYLHNATIYSSPIVAVGDTDEQIEGKKFRAYAMSYVNEPGTQPKGYYKEVSQNVIQNKIVVNYIYDQMREVLTHTANNNVKFVIDTNKYTPDPSDVIWNSRAINKWFGTGHPVYSNGIILNAIVWRKQEIPGTDAIYEAISIRTIAAPVSGDLLRKMACVLMAFKWSPLIYVTIKEGGFYYLELVGDINNIHVCEDVELENINDIVMYSLFDIPQH